LDKEFFMRRAIALSVEQVAKGGGPFGAVIVKDGQIIAEGANVVTGSFDPTAHAEIVAIRAAAARLQDFSLAGCEIYASAEPCPMCLAAIYWARIDRIYFGNTRHDAALIGFDDEFLYREIVLPVTNRMRPTESLLRDEAAAAFAAWAASTDKIPY
jgi:guanine deaminase